MTDSFPLVTLLDVDHKQARGDGAYPIYPSLGNGVVDRNPNETPIAQFTAKKLVDGDVLLTNDAPVKITLTSERVIFEVPKWKWDAGLVGQITALTAERSANERWTLAGHLPLECIATLSYSVNKPSYVLITAVYNFQFEGRHGRLEIGWKDSAAEVRRIGVEAVKASKARWRQHGLPDGLTAAIDSESPRPSALSRSFGRKSQSLDYQSPAALFIGHPWVIAPSDNYSLFPGSDPLKIDPEAVVAPVPQAKAPPPPVGGRGDRDGAEAGAASRRDIEGRLAKVTDLYRNGLITDEEQKRKRQEIIDDF